MTSLAELFDDLAPDDWRRGHPFSLDLAKCQDAVFSATDDVAWQQLLGEWLAAYQPCLFGKLAAKQGWIDYCFLTESDLRSEDHQVGSKISQKRTSWFRRARQGESHAFVILAISERLANAEPNSALLAFAQRLAHLYLCHPVSPDEMVHDQLSLERAECRRWKAGVNFFSAQGDGRWWQDHRIPGGVAFSMNSVGHMACTRRLGKDMGVEDQSQGLYWALSLAMKLLDDTKPGPSGRDTWLHTTADVAPTVGCPFELPKAIKDKNWCQYGGLYHTDVSIPSEYFKPDQLRPDGPVLTDLDLTYLHHDSPDNPDFQSMGLGQSTR